MRRGVSGTAVAAVAMVALTGSQATGTATGAAASGSGKASPRQETSGDTHYDRELPPLVARYSPGSPARPSPGAGPVVAAGHAAIPGAVLSAYRKAEASLARSAPGCELRWQLLAAIGQVESGQARGGRVDAAGTTYTPIIGPQLNGRGFAEIRDTDGGAYDGDSSYDHAVGPMQFIPSTWAVWGADGNGDGAADPHNVHDAALSAGRYLCAGGRDLSRARDLGLAILSYNRSQEYLRTVLAWYGYFSDGHRVVPGPSGEGSGSGSGPGSRAQPGSSGAAKPERGGPGPRAGAASSGPGSPPPSHSPEPSPEPAPAPESAPEPAPTDPPVVRVSPAPLATTPGTGTGLPGDEVLPDVRDGGR
ncbi:lytic transglycosylase domain-containing protein [Streptomyces sp. WAC 00631]|uniref:lytic transglycosylase domain-containing protein n=1 Tax=Streptomyces sp. WAC 00631 TaxID=2203201 RepID=UPI001E575483|nr:lytic transglycosylase domain-containing protein [Streptomyces sp. WAC 00631]MCC5035300.1 lytic transglycosylase domain-containing protein [Streptomyces sp. WAC 00631]